ncbi:MAG: BatA domain-containing protein [Gemmataceae bacterium]|nr:BatA domain-containing protein [Gemmataceae bacterium]
MTFVFPILLGGLVLAGIPILLHLILRQKPKTLQFPAFRFLVQKHRSNLRKLQLRHLLLLALRMLLLAALCLALARPRLFHESFNLNSERPIATILIFDTSPTMDYRMTDKLSRLEEAKARGKELVKALPDGSRVLVLDTADTVVSDRGDWLINKALAVQRIDGLKIKPANATVARAVEQALRVFQTATRSAEDEGLRSLPRLLCVFSDRTTASWPSGKQTALAELTDPLPATLEGVQQVRSAAAPLLDLLKDLRTKLPPPAGKDYPEQALVESVQTLRDRAAGVQRGELQTDDGLRGLIVQTRRQARALRDTLVELGALGEQRDAATEEYRTKTLSALHGLLRHIAGVQALWIDVGVEQPVDVALVQLEFPPQADGRAQHLFGATDKFIVRVLAQALGKEVSTAVQCQVGKETMTRQVDLKVGERPTIPFEIDLAKLDLGVGAHTLTVKLANKDALESNNQLFAAFQIRQPKRVLILADAKSASADRFAYAFECVGYVSEIKTRAELAGLEWDKYQAAYLFGLAAPGPELWQAAAAYVQKGGGLGIVPGGAEMKPEAYHQPAANELLPGKWQTVVKHDPKKPGVTWNLDAKDIDQHSVLKPFRAWRDNLNIDFIAKPRWAHAYWKFEPDKKATVLVTYRDKGDPPALVERLPGGSGKVLVFTTPLDDREPRWNNYLESETSFYLTLAFLTAKHLTGDDHEANLNFQSGVDEPRVTLPLAPRFETYTLRGLEMSLFESINADPQVNELRFKDVSLPGNYAVEGHAAPGQAGTPVARFSVNLQAQEADLTRTPAAAVEAVFGDGAVIPTERGVDLRELLKSQWNEPLELFPYLMVLLLFVLALENLLANKFYRRQD